MFPDLSISVVYRCGWGRVGESRIVRVSDPFPEAPICFSSKMWHISYLSGETVKAYRLLSRARCLYVHPSLFKRWTSWKIYEAARYSNETLYYRLPYYKWRQQLLPLGCRWLKNNCHFVHNGPGCNRWLVGDICRRQQIVLHVWTMQR